MKDVETVELERDGAVAWVALNRPRQHNALNAKLVNELTLIFRDIGDQADVRVIVLTGNGLSFCAGADLSTFEGMDQQSENSSFPEGEAIFDLLMSIDSVPQPVIGRINGAAIGGGMGLVSCCDVAVASDDARFGFSEVRLGLVAAVVSPFVISKIGISRARELFLGGERFDGKKALEIGLIHELSPTEELDLRIRQRLDQLLLAAPGAQADSKRLIKRVAYQQIDEMRDFTTNLFSQRWQSEEAQEGIRSFLEKRKPNWQK